MCVCVCMCVWREQEGEVTKNKVEISAEGTGEERGVQIFVIFLVNLLYLSHSLGSGKLWNENI